MKKYFTQIIFFTFLYLSSAVITFAQVSNIVFTTSPQTVRPNVISEPITIQAQDGEGNPYQTQETIDLEFISSSPTGEFLGGTGKPAQKYMSKNTAKRTFYYRDSSEGDFTITVNAKGRESVTEWSASQTIILSSTAEAPKKEKNETLVKKAEPKVEAKKEEPKKVEVEVETEGVKEKEVVVVPKVSVPAPVIEKEKPKEKVVVNEVAAVALSEAESTTTSSVVIFESVKSESLWSRFWHFILSIFS